jgi:hypothetical protein
MKFQISNLRWLLLLLLLPTPLLAQSARYERRGNGVPSGACRVGQTAAEVYINSANGDHYTCKSADGNPSASGTWALSGNSAAGTGTVTTSGSPASPQLAKFSSGTAITTATATDVSTPQFCADAGSTDTYACSLVPAPAAYVVGTHLRFFANTANTGAASVNFNAIGALTIVKVAGGITTASSA